jgi:5'-3' exonuclease
MGIHGFFAHFVKIVPNVIHGLKKDQTIRSMKKSGKPVEIDILAFELNPIFYDVYNELRTNIEASKQNSGSLLRQIKSKKPIQYTSDEYVQKIYEGVMEVVDTYVQCNQPKYSIYFVIDGVAGMSKQTQQRQRRYRYNQPEVEGEFSSVRITPGTEFLFNFSKVFKEHIKEKMRTDWKHLNVYFNDARVVGEGEHKLIEYIRSLPSNLSISIISPDADLFMLTMGLRRSDIYVFKKLKDYEKKDEMKDKEYSITDLDVLKNYIIEESGILPEIDKTSTLEETKEQKSKSLLDVYKENKDAVDDLEDNKLRAIEDFILFMMIVGNDFLPHIPHIEIKDIAKDLIEYYKNTVKECGFITKRNKENTDIILNHKAFKHIFKELSQDSREYYRVRKDARISKIDNPYVLLDRNKFLTDQRTEINLEKYKKDYYTVKLNLGVNFEFTDNGEQQMTIDNQRYEKELKQLVHEYIRGMVFVIRYYLFKIPTYNWFYPYHYSPFTHDVWKYFPDDLDFKFDYAPPLTSFEQLLCVLPPAKSTLLPEPLRGLMTAEDSPIRDMYPSSWITDKDGSNNRNEGGGLWKELLPFSDYDRVRENFNKLKDKLTKEEQERNAIGNIYKYTFASNKVLENISNI